MKENFPEYKSIMETLRTKLVAMAAADWAPKTFGGMAPKAGQFGESTIMPELFRSCSTGTAATATLTTWNQWLDTTGNNTIMSGSNVGTTYEDYKIGLAGIALLDKATRISEIRMQIADRKIPRINIEEALCYKQTAIVFEQPFIVDEESGFDLYAYVTNAGPARIKLLGLQLNRVPNKLQTSNCMAALT